MSKLEDEKCPKLRKTCAAAGVEKGRKAEMIERLREKLEGGAIVLGHIDVGGSSPRPLSEVEQAEQTASRLLSGRGDSAAALQLLDDLDHQEIDIHPRMRHRLEAMAVWARLSRGWNDLNNGDFDGVRGCLTALALEELPPKEEKSRLALTRALPGAAEGDRARREHARRQPQMPKALRMSLRR